VSCFDPPPASGGDPAFVYDLPAELIAQDPAASRAASRLLLVAPGEGPVGEVPFRELPRLLRAGDLLVLNDSRVIPARLWTRRRRSGGRVELLLVRPEGEAADRHWLALARPVRRLRAGSILQLTDLAGDRVGPAELQIQVAAVLSDGYVKVGCASGDLAAVAERWGEMPLPPYIRREADDPLCAERRGRDRRRYQTVYAEQPGSVAAPTAGLHFEPAVLAELAAAGVQTAQLTLHVGPGTFRPPSEDQLRQRRLHREVFRYPAGTDAAVVRTRAGGGRVIAVGTTSLRVLETIHRLRLRERTGSVLTWDDNPAPPRPVFYGRAERRPEGWEVTGSTRLFIGPPDRPAAADGLLTNFHLPGSSLLMLVAAVAGQSAWRRAYNRAVAEHFRFYSYGDAMLILPGQKET